MHVGSGSGSGSSSGSDSNYLHISAKNKDFFFICSNILVHYLTCLPRIGTGKEKEKKNIEISC